MSQQKQPPLVNLSSIGEKFFRKAIRYHVYEYWSHFQDRLAAIYVGGSIHRNEAVPGISDLDLYPFLIDSVNKEDRNWFNQAEQRVESRFASANGLCLPRSVNEIFGGLQSTADETARVKSHAWMYRLRYDTTLIFGKDLIAGLHVSDMNKNQAGDYFQSAWDLVRYAAGLETRNKTDFHLPKDSPRLLRKLARLAILGGAYLLIGRGELYSFKGAEILPILNAHCPDWQSFFDETKVLYISLNPSVTEREISHYLSQLVLWMDWVGKQLNTV